MDEVDKSIKVYFQFSNQEILAILAHSDKVVISISTLKRKLKKLGLCRRKNYSDSLEIAVFILSQLETSGRLHGYRWMHLKCKQAGYNIARDTVYQLMKLLDPIGIQNRKRKRLRRRQYFSPGPNVVWHIDSYDKLKPYGIAINGCIDGYSRYLIWLEAATTNSDPKVIANYYLDSVRKKGGCPKRIRADLGTENVYIGNMQMFLRRDHTDEYSGAKSFLTGRSTHNQRIEWFWGLLRKELGQYYMDIFADMKNDMNDLYCGDLLDKSLMQFCFLEIIQRELDDLRDTWNTHVIRTKPRGAEGNKRPVLMYSLPQLYHLEDHICPVLEDEIMICETESSPKTLTCTDETVLELCNLILEENNLQRPSDTNEARHLYQLLRRLIRSGLDNIL